MEMTREALQQWAANWKEANEYERKLKFREHGRYTPAQYLAQMLDLIAFADHVPRMPGRHDLVEALRVRENAKVEAAWMKLRARWGRGR